MLNPFIDLIAQLIQLYIYCIFAWFIVDILIAFNVINRQQPFVMRLRYALNRMITPVLDPIRKRLPDLGSIDISPIILIILLNFTINLLYHYLYNL